MARLGLNSKDDSLKRNILTIVLLICVTPANGDGFPDYLIIASEGVIVGRNAHIRNPSLALFDETRRLTEISTSLRDGDAIDAISGSPEQILFTTTSPASSSTGSWLSSAVLELGSDQQIQEFSFPGMPVGFPDIAALSVKPSALYFSPKKVARFETVIVFPQDIAKLEGGSISVEVDGSEVGIPETVRMSAIEALENGSFLLALSKPVEINGVAIESGDIAFMDPDSSPTISVFRQRAFHFGPCESCRVTGIAAQINRDVIFRDSFTSPWN